MLPIKRAYYGTFGKSVLLGCTCLIVIDSSLTGIGLVDCHVPGGFEETSSVPLAVGYFDAYYSGNLSKQYENTFSKRQLFAHTCLQEMQKPLCSYERITQKMKLF
ncbi:MAG: hypothetical protein ACR2OX_06800 [Methyloligellaceae bacterium]